jgi:hypothetical protein
MTITPERPTEELSMMKYYSSAIQAALLLKLLQNAIYRFWGYLKLKMMNFFTWSPLRRRRPRPPVPRIPCR